MNVSVAKGRGDRSPRRGIFREAGLWGLWGAHLVLVLAISRPVQAAFPVLAGDPVDPSTGEAYVILPGLPLILPPVGGTTVVDLTKIGDVDIVIRAGSVLAGPSIPPPASTPPTAIAGGTHVAPGTEVPFTVIASDGLASAPFGGPLLGPEMDGLPVVVFAWADLDRDGFVGPTDADAAGATDDVREEQEALFPVGRQIAFFRNGVAAGTVAIAIGAPASDGGLPVVLTAAAYVGEFLPGGPNTFFGNVPIGPAVATLLPFMPRFDPDRVVEAHGGGGRAEPSRRLGVNLEPMFDVPVGDPVLGTPFALPTDGSSPTIDRALVASGDVIRARFVQPSSPTGFPVGVAVALFPGADGALYEALPLIDVPDDGPGGEVAARLVPVDGLDDVADPPPGFTVTLLAAPGLVIASPDLDGDPAVEVVPVASAAGLDVLVGDANGPGDSGAASTLTVLADGYPVETLAVRFTPGGGGTSTTTSTTSTTSTRPPRPSRRPR